MKSKRNNLISQKLMSNEEIMLEEKYKSISKKDSKKELKSILSQKKNGKVLLVTACTGLGFNMAPHFGIYQILNYLLSKNIDCDIYDRDLAFFGKTNIDEAKVLKNLELRPNHHHL